MFFAFFLVQKEGRVDAIEAFIKPKNCIFMGNLRKNEFAKDNDKTELVAIIQGYLLLKRKILQIDMEIFSNVCYNAKHSGCI